MTPDDRTAAGVRRWNLRLGPALTGGFRSQVRACTTSSGTAAVLKVPTTVEEAELEAAALSLWHETGATVRLLDYDPHNGVLLLERLRPGTPLPAGDDPRMLDEMADLLGRLHGITVPDGFPSLAQLYPRLAEDSLDDIRHERLSRREPNRAAAAMNLMESAGKAAQELCSTAAATRLLHGDFLDKNLLRHGTRYAATDPIPRIGEPESEIGFFAGHHPPVSGIFDRGRRLAERLGADPGRTARWAAVWVVLLTTSAWREDQPELDALVGSASFTEVLTG